MDKKLLLCCALFSVVTWSQTPKGFKLYPATDSWNFICENYALTGTAGIQIAKTEKGGIIKIFIETTNPTYIISGMLYLFLKDNTIVTCVDRAWRETDGKTITSYYLFSAVEISKLKNTEIESIHFNIKGKPTGFTSQIGNFTAVNKKQFFSTAFDKTRKTYDTATEIRSLYKN